ncbi:hypothetical protein A3C86_01405 [Candidatus Kaiserbacteria bacterium RIFCSPHIGHO2_02_FULL_49_16]|uniref:Uncharacterized protein n=1 Tax=Candidatus Kaiserbacteria bacterium RIFCSPHIGHO2_02_FULL_49_16 TaxID=1798490 RepID=A0A1F6DC62_9BACT|nr:MAG: hypothetical protein A3C86_01405 [Candidatus Kaiserbacteria bacterium RIFCSPHIGHO2_02_FULL_49_16]
MAFGAFRGMKQKLLRDNPVVRKLEQNPASEAGFSYDKLLGEINGIPDVGEGTNPQYAPMKKLKALRGFISSFKDRKERSDLELAFDNRASRFFEKQINVPTSSGPQGLERGRWLEARLGGFERVVGAFPFFRETTREDLLKKARGHE